MDDLVKNVYDSDFDTKVKNKITENAKRLITNYQLVDFLPIDGSIEENIIKCEQRIGELKIWYKVLKIELESWMQSTEELKKNFLKQKEYKRVRGR
jgi:hypothetical protein